MKRHFLYIVTATMPRCVRVLVNGFLRPLAEPNIKKLCPAKTIDTATQEEIKTYQAIFASDLLDNWATSTRHNIERA